MLTIIVPFFDEVIYLRNALNSILAQRIDDIQIIVVNDNPDQFSQRDLVALGATGRVELIQHPRNLGLSAARNSGMAQAHGRYVGFLDSDDYYTLGGLAHQLATAVSTGADMTHAQTCFTHLGSAEARILPRDAALFSRPVTLAGLAAAQQAQFITSSWSSLYARAFLNDNDLWFDAEQTRFEDRLFVLNTVTRARSISFTGRPNRVWRRRSGSISASATTPETHLLQVQLLEKCMARMRDEVGSGRLAPVFEKRELFNTVSRLIWDMDLIGAICENPGPAYAAMATRVSVLLGDETFGHSIFSDRTLAPISRIGMKTAKGRIGRAAFFAIHKALREGDFTEAAHRIGTHVAPQAPALAKGRRLAKRLVLHLGLHKTGTTYIQQHLLRHRDQLMQRGVLLPLAGFDELQDPTRAGATPGHQGLVRALHKTQSDPWQDLTREIRQSKPETVILSCENMAFPTLANRETTIAKLAQHLRDFDVVDLVALGRRADMYVEAFYRERVANGMRTSGEGLAGFVADHAGMLCNLPGLFAPFEAQFDTTLRLGDFDALAGDQTLWPGFMALAGLPEDLPVLDVAHYRTPDRETIRVLHLLNTLVANAGLRRDILTAWFSLHPAPGSTTSLLSPQERLKLLDLWQDLSGDYAGTRGYAPDLTTARTDLQQEVWQPVETLPATHLQELISLANQAVSSDPARATGAPNPPLAPSKRGDMSLTIRLRPWIANIIRRFR